MLIEYQIIKVTSTRKGWVHLSASGTHTEQDSGYGLVSHIYIYKVESLMDADRTKSGEQVP